LKEEEGTRVLLQNLHTLYTHWLAEQQAWVKECTYSEEALKKEGATSSTKLIYIN